jgi:hypothetical protein
LVCSAVCRDASELFRFQSSTCPASATYRPSLGLATVALAGRLAAADGRFADWVKKVGVKHGPVQADEKQDMIDELDAIVARLGFAVH